MKSKEFSLADVVQGRRDKRSWADIAEDAGAVKSTLVRWAHRQPDFPPELLLPYTHEPKQLSTEDIRRMVEDEGLEDITIAQRLDMKVASFARLRARRGLRRRDPKANRPPTAEQLAVAEAYLDEGYSYSATHELSGVGEKTLARHFPGRGFTREQTIEAAVMTRKFNEIDVAA